MYMTGYTKLFGTIVASTIWRESKETKIVWITMLAMANKDGVVEASVPGLADMARVTVSETKDALNTLLDTDEYSRTKDYDGRRIIEVDGGWAILNHAKYRAKMNEDERRNYLRLKQQEFRAKSKAVNIESTNVNNCSDLSTLSTQAEEEPDSDPLPECLRTDLFRSAWEGYRAYRVEQKLKKLGPSSIKAKLKEMAEWGEQQAIEAIKTTIANGWTGIFKPKPDGKTNQRPITSRNTGTANEGKHIQYAGIGKIVSNRIQK